jgi:hypothetical protein
MIFLTGLAITLIGALLFTRYGNKPWSWIPFWCMPVGVVIMIDAIVTRLSLLH